jgi:hypothetical protein
VYKSQVHRLFYAHEGGLGPHTVVLKKRRQDDLAGCVWGGGGRGGGVRPAALSGVYIAVEFTGNNGKVGFIKAQECVIK